MDEHNMLHKANSIASFFSAYPHDEAVASVLNHIRMYWVPRMRAQLIEYVKDHGNEGLNPLVAEAVAKMETPVIRT